MRACGFFESMDDEAVSILRPAAKRVLQPKNTVIFNEGEPCRGFYIVEQGVVKIYKESPEAKEHVIHVATRGDCFGEAALFLGTGYPASAAAVQDSALILLRKEEFLEALHNHPEVGLRLMASMAMWAHRLVSKIESLTLRDASSRLSGYLLSKLPENASDGAVVDLGMPKQVLASTLGMTGETLSRLLARFEAEGLMLTRGRRVKVLSIEAVREVAEFGRL